MKTFIDPASYSTGYAKFSDDYTLLESGTISSDLKDPFDRIWDIASGYIHLFPEAQEGDEVHIERMAEKTHYMVKWSVGCIGAVLAARKYKVDQAVDISSWQKYVGWSERKKEIEKYKKKAFGKYKAEIREVFTGSKLEQYVEQVWSLDELAAIGMGLWWESRG